MFYVEPDANLLGNNVTAGDVVGQLQSLQSAYPGITDHVHVELRINGTLTDPTGYIPVP